jgi:hypothetical protein
MGSHPRRIRRRILGLQTTTRLIFKAVDQSEAAHYIIISAHITIYITYIYYITYILHIYITQSPQGGVAKLPPRGGKVAKPPPLAQGGGGLASPPPPRWRSHPRGGWRSPPPLLEGGSTWGVPRLATSFLFVCFFTFPYPMVGKKNLPLRGAGLPLN